MIRDPFYQDIIKRLNGKLDPELFQQCVSDTLRVIYPGLVPILGGSDAGMDGAISDTESVAFPLIATTEEDVIGNLTKNLHSYLEDSGPRRKIVLATSQKLTPQRRRNLEQRARQLGFESIQTFTQEALANLLYRNPQWCQELLGLSGQPPALSVIPITSRPQIVKLLIGRENDLDWLINTEGDLLLVGQPGSGKTFLLQTYARQYEGLFLINDDPTQISAAIREQNPKTIIVDDAHIYSDRLNNLRQLRDQLGAEYRIVAVCWPGMKDSVLQLIQRPTSSMHDLEPLSRDQIVELIKSAGIMGPNELIRELVNQAEGRPGLAATLCYLCVKGDIRQIALGDSLSRDIRTTFEPLLGSEATAIIAAFSFGGDKGMPMEAVANQLRLSPTQIHQVVTGLAAGGVLTDIGQGRLSVRPPVLRYALVRDVFFSGATRLPYHDLIQESPDMVETALTLIGSCARGARIPPDLLTKMVNEVDSNKVWEAFSYLGQDECTWVVDNRLEKLPVIAESALYLIPQKAIPLLLTLAINDTRQLHSYPDHPLRKVESWVKSGKSGSREVISRRETLLDSTLSWFAETPNTHIALQAIKYSLSPSFSDSEMGPGSQITVTFLTGLITKAEMSVICGFWPRVMEFLRSAPIEDWGPMLDLIQEWLYPGRGGSNISEEIQGLMREFACEMAIDIISINNAHPGVLSQISRIFKPLKIELPFDLNPEFDTLFPAKDLGKNWEEDWAKQLAAANKLAEKWSLQDAENIADCIVRFEIEARNANITWPRWSVNVAERIASEVRNPSTWARSFIKAGAESDLVIPFLRVTALVDGKEYTELLKMCLEVPRLHFACASAGLTAAFLPEDLLPVIMSIVDDRFSNWIEVSCSRLEIPEDRLVKLMTHPNCVIAAAAATGEWQATPRGIVRDVLKDSWRKTIISCLEREYEGEEIFREDPSIAFEWLLLRIKENRISWYHDENVLNTALQVINVEQRKALLENIDDGLFYGEIIQGIVDNELEIYRNLLQNSRLNRFHLSPLMGNLTGVWIDKTLLALDAGYSPSDVSQAVYGSFRSWSGNESTYWAQWAESFEILLTHDDPRIRIVGQFGKDHALKERDRALARECLEDIRGR